MGVELRPLGVKCNIRCEYCYQNPQRKYGSNSIQTNGVLIDENHIRMFQQ